MSAAAEGPADYARRCVVALVEGHEPPAAPDEPLYRRPSACFVSLKKRGDLRGCIGTLAPEEHDLGHEIARNAYGAAFRDPRFPPVQPPELDELTCSVDVLGPPEPCDPADLDPARYGIIVSAGWRRGVLLPDLPGVDSVARQVAIALQKAGIPAHEEYTVQRFTVRRFREGDPEGIECGDAGCVPGCGERPGDDRPAS